MLRSRPFATTGAVTETGAIENKIVGHTGSRGAPDYKLDLHGWSSNRHGVTAKMFEKAGKPMTMNETPDQARKSGDFNFLRVPLFRLLAINLAIGIALAALLVGGLLALNPSGLRDLILADSSPGTALGLLLFGFVVTFGSTAMGTAIMAMGQRPADDSKPPRGKPMLAAQRLGRSATPAGRQR